MGSLTRPSPHCVPRRSLYVENDDVDHAPHALGNLIVHMHVLEDYTNKIESTAITFHFILARPLLRTQPGDGRWTCSTRALDSLASAFGLR